MPIEDALMDQDRCPARNHKSAKAKGYHYFAIQYYGVCYSGPTTTNPHSLSQVTNFCTTYNYQECEPTSELPCVGRNLTNFVYHLEEGNGETQTDDDETRTDNVKTRTNYNEKRSGEEETRTDDDETRTDDNRTRTERRKKNG
ncbi:predicted protein [Nematostella vectensis]|uniref:Uncharacterized protein n=1 Tax=Nematostella vectensis TaxID=45351 RepID=A7S5E8_NEMVE|nr:predicted protein [Nematostella vectensis]|eukprot:XP_001633137.1 predicted protein [Nematostella vectensis]